ncbi:EamA family transporter [Clostridium carnis]
MKNYKGIIYAIISSAAFGLMPIFAKVAYENESNPTTVLIFRFFIATTLLFLYLKYKKVEMKVSKEQVKILLLIGFFGYTITTETLFMSYDYLGAGLATTLHFIYPAIVCIIGFVVFKEKMSKSKVISLLLAIIGVYALIAFENQVLNIIGVILAIFSGITYGLVIISFGLKSIKGLDNRVTTMYVTLGAGVGMLLYGLFTNDILLNINLENSLSYIGIAVISTILSMILLLKSIEIIGTSSSSILGTFEPIVSIILGVILFGEELTLALAIGTLCILSSTIILAKGKK